jgi:lipopolysaccharide/colanic/teichoic acid biosynthesis glycosyltransferase
MHRSRLPSSKSTLSYRLIAFDVATAFIAPILALYLRDPGLFGSVDSGEIAIYVSVGGGVSILFFILFRLAHGLPRYFSFRDAIEIAQGSACAAAVTAALLFSFTRLEAIPRSIPAIHFLVLIAVLIAGRLVRRITIQRREIGSVFDIKRNDERNLVIVGAGHLAWFYIRLLDSFAIDNRRVVAILDDNESLRGRSMFGHVILGGTAEAATILDDFTQHGIEISGFVICERNKERAVELSYRLESLCLDRGLQLELLADKLGVLKGTPEQEVRDCPPFPAIFPNVNYFRIKRAIEATFATFALLIFLPLLILVGLLVLIRMGSPVLFWQHRIGRNGRIICIYKFKTMYNTIGRTGRLLTESERTSGVGQFLRATRLDELPQLYSVINGDMGLIGPRPLLLADQPVQPTLRLVVAPGITGWAQIHGGKLVSVAEKNDLDDWYVHNASLSLDLKILLRTIFIVLTGDRRTEKLSRALALAAEDKRRRQNGRVPAGDGATFGEPIPRPHRRLPDGRGHPAADPGTAAATSSGVGVKRSVVGCS